MDSLNSVVNPSEGWDSVSHYRRTLGDASRQRTLGN